MYAKLFAYQNGVKKLDAVIRIVDGRLQLDEGASLWSRELLEGEYAAYKAKFPHNPDEMFLIRLQEVVFGRSTYSSVQLISE